MPTKNRRFRPTIQQLDSRKLMAADLGLQEVDVTPEQPSKDVIQVDVGSIDGYSASDTAGGLADVKDGISNTFMISERSERVPSDQYFAELGDDAGHKVRDAIDVLSWSWGETNS